MKWVASIPCGNSSKSIETEEFEHHNEQLEAQSTNKKQKQQQK